MYTIKLLKIYIGHIAKLTFGNKLRFYLSMVGICVGVFLFSTGNIVIDSYFSTVLESIEEMNKHTITLQIETGNNEFTDKIESIKPNKQQKNIITNSMKNIYLNSYGNDVNLVINANLANIKGENRTVFPVKTGSETLLQKDVQLIEGRMITDSDQNCVVIDELVKKIVFHDESCVGKEIEIGPPSRQSVTISQDGSQMDESFKCKIVGVVKGNTYTKEQYIQLRKFLKNPSKSLFLNTLIYCSNDVIKSQESDFSRETVTQYMWTLEDIAEKQDLEQLLESYRFVYASSYTSYVISDYNTVIQGKHKELQSIRIITNVVVFVLMVLAGINIMSIMFFSIKERIVEIGIKKALGATKLDILLQLELEGIAISAISAIIAIFLSVYVTNILQYEMNYNLFVYFKIEYSVSNMLIPFLVALVYGFAFSFIPSLYGASIQVTEALKFE